MTLSSIVTHLLPRGTLLTWSTHSSGHLRLLVSGVIDGLASLVYFEAVERRCE